jgi:hypothetical protein
MAEMFIEMEEERQERMKDRKRRGKNESERKEETLNFRGVYVALVCDDAKFTAP